MVSWKERIPLRVREALAFWDQLRRAGFVSGSGAENPFNAVSGKMGVQTGDGSGAAPAGVLGTAAEYATRSPGCILCSGNLPDKIAISVDAQMDDGLGKTGSVRTMKGSGYSGARRECGRRGLYRGRRQPYLVCRQM